jgi:hypothetical protein
MVEVQDRKSTWETLQQQAGAFKGVVSVRSEVYQQDVIVYGACQFEQAALDARLVCNPGPVKRLCWALDERLQTQFEWQEDRDVATGRKSLMIVSSQRLSRRFVMM